MPESKIMGAYIRETREMAEKAAKQNPESKFIGLDDYFLSCILIKHGFMTNRLENVED